MKEIDEFLATKLPELLLPGERVGFAGLVMRPLKFNVLRVPEKYDGGWLAVATQTRLLLLETEGQGVLTSSPKPICKSVVEWKYQDLQEVNLGSVAGVLTGKFFFLRPHPALGPFPPKVIGHEEHWGVRYDMFPKCSNWEGHANFYNGFSEWLSAQVQAGAFPMDADSQAKVQAHAAKLEAEAAERRRLAEEARLRREAMLGKIGAGLRKVLGFGGKAFQGSAGWIVLAAVLVLGSLSSCGMAGYQQFDRIPTCEEWIKRAEEPLDTSYMSEHEIERQERNRAESRERWPKKLTTAKITRTVSLLLSWGLIGLAGFVLKAKSGGTSSEADMNEGAAPGTPPPAAGPPPGPPPGAPPGPPPAAPPPPPPGPPPAAPPPPPPGPPPAAPPGPPPAAPPPPPPGPPPAAPPPPPPGPPPA